MLNKSVITFVLAVTLAMAGLSWAAQTDTPETPPDNVPDLLVKANTAYVARDYLAFRKALESLHSMRPNNSQYMYQLVIAHALLDEKSKAYEMMLKMQQQGLAYDFSAVDTTANIRGTEVFDYLNDLMKMAAQPMGESETAFVLPASVALPETIAWDESRQKFLVGTIAQGAVLAVDKDGQLTELIKANKENGMWAILDILVDQARNRLWISSAATPAFSGFDPVDKGRSALFEFDLETLKFIRRYPVPVDGRPHILGSMAQTPNGDIYIVDRVLPIIYAKLAGEQKLTARMGLKDMISMRGVAMQPDGRVMYVADREMGIMVVDLEGGRAAKLAAPETLNIGGIDGLYLSNNHLIIIQNGTSPQRLMRLDLDASGTQIAAVRPLAVAQAEFDSPSFGTVKGEDLYYFANRQTTDSDGQLKAVTVLRTPLDSSKELVQPDMQKYLEQRAEQMKARQKNAEENKSETPPEPTG